MSGPEQPTRPSRGPDFILDLSVRTANEVDLVVSFEVTHDPQKLVEGSVAAIATLQRIIEETMGMQDKGRAS